MHLLFLTVLLFAVSIGAEPVDTTPPPIVTTVVLSSHNAITKEYLSALEQPGDTPVKVLLLDDFVTQTQCDKAECLYIALGHKVFNTLTQQLKTAPVLSTLTSSITFDTLSSNRPYNISAIYAEPSMDHQLELTQSIYKKAITIGVLYSDKSLKSIIDLEEKIGQHHFKLLKHKVVDNKNIRAALAKLAKADVLLAIPDNTIYNKQNFREVILSTYRNNQPVIGFSRNFVKSGALASSYSDIQHIAQETRLVIHHYTAHRQLPEPFHANNRGIAVNDQVSISLGITIRSDDFLYDDFELIKGSRYVSSH